MIDGPIRHTRRPTESPNTHQSINPSRQLCAAKIIFEKKHGISPFAPGQWKAFLAIYGGLWAAMNFVRPLRVWIGAFRGGQLTAQRKKGNKRLRKALSTLDRRSLALTCFALYRPPTRTRTRARK